MGNFREKTYASTFIYSKRDGNGVNAEQQLIEFIKTADRCVDKNHPSMQQISNMLKERMSNAVLYRVYMDPNTVIAISKNKELPASFKVFEAKDIATNGKAKVFIDVTGLFKFENGYYSCKNIDVLCSYLLAAMVIGSYYKDSYKFTSNVSIVKSAATCYTKLFTAVLDNLRVSNFAENRNKISYIVCVFFLYNMLQKDLKSSQQMATSLLMLNARDTAAYDYYYHEDEDFKDINTLIISLTENFKLKGLTTDIFLHRWLTLYGKGTLYATELFPMLMVLITNAYSGSYINRQNMIENVCGREIVSLTTSLIKVGSEIYDKGFTFDANTRRDLNSYNNRKS